jgi:hypothetical protein
MIWIGCIDKIGSMAVDTNHRQCGELIIDMTILAQDSLMNAGQRELRVVV